MVLVLVLVMVVGVLLKLEGELHVLWGCDGCQCLCGMSEQYRLKYKSVQTTIILFFYQMFGVGCVVFLSLLMQFLI